MRCTTSMRYSDAPGNRYIQQHPASCEGSAFYRCERDNYPVNLGWPGTYNCEAWNERKFGTSCAFSDPNAAVRDNIDYEYYVWDEEYGEYVRTDQSIGEKLLSDPRYFQYHYTVVESDADHQRSFVRRSSSISDREAIVQEHENVEDAFHGAHTDGQCLLDDASPSHFGYALTRESKARRIQQHSRHEKFYECHNHLWSSMNGQRVQRHQGPIRCVDNHTNCSGSTQAAGNRALLKHRKSAARSPSQECMSLTQLLSGGMLKLRPPVSCSRPWERPASAREPQRLKRKECHQLLRPTSGKSGYLSDPSAPLQPYTGFDKLALQCRNTPRHVSERLENTGTRDPLARSKYTRFTGASTVQRGDVRRKANDPVSRGCYFRDVWKSDRFLVQQANPSFDIKAYDTWLKNRGHMLRARTLELQKEERRLLMLMQEQELRSGNTWRRK